MLLQRAILVPTTLVLPLYSSIQGDMSTMINPNHLVGLKQACFVMDSLVDQHREERIAQKLQGDAQLTRMWILFLRHNNWVTEASGMWTITPKGTMWRKKVAVANK